MADSENGSEQDPIAPLSTFIIDFNSDENSKEYSRDLQDLLEENFLSGDVDLEDYVEMSEQLNEERLDIENSYFGRVMTRSTLRIPKFQRNYSWTEDNHEHLWYGLRDTLLSLNDEDDRKGSLRENFFGVIYVSAEDVEENQLQVIDGQQRLATTAIILNVLRRRMQPHIDHLEDEEKEFCQYVLNHFIVKPLYGDSADNGRSTSLSIELRGYDEKYFKLLFDDSNRRVLGIIDEMEEGHTGEWLKISTLLKKIGRKPNDLEERDLQNFDNGFLDRKVYYASKGSHSKLLDAHSFYNQVVEDFLSDDLELDEEHHRERIFTMVNIALILMRSFRVIRSRLSQRVSPETKVQFFQSLNETGESLTISDKIRARTVAEFGFDSDEIEDWEEVTEEFGDNSDNIEDYLSDYIMSTIERDNIPGLSEESPNETEDSDSEENEDRSDEENKQENGTSEGETSEDNINPMELIKKSVVSGNLLDAFAISTRPRPELNSKLIGESATPATFFSNLEETASRYNEITRKELNSEYFDSDSAVERCAEYLDRIEGKQWRPFVLLLYNERANGTSINDDVMIEMLDTVENLLLRLALTGARTSNVETTFTSPCLYYNEREVPDIIQERLDIDANDFNVLDTDLLSELLLESTTLGDLTQNSLTNALLFNNTWSRLDHLLIRVAQENMRNSGGESARRATGHRDWLKGDELEMEHILPRTPKLSDAKVTNSWLIDFLGYEESASTADGEATEGGESMPAWLNEEAFKAAVDKSPEGERVFERIKTLFIEDPGNRMLLHKTVNKRIRNKPFSIKFAFYYLTSYNDLDLMDEYLADPENLDTTFQEVVQLIDSLADTADLTKQEANVLFYRSSVAFSMSEKQISDELTHYSLTNWDRISRDGVAEYESVTNLLSDLSINESEHGRIYEDDWHQYEIQTRNGRLVFVYEGDEDGDEDVREYEEFMHEAVEAILLKVARIDVTDSDEVEDIVLEFNKKWTWEKMVDRKAYLATNVLSSLGFSTREFDREEISKEAAYKQIYSQTDQAF